MMKAAVEANADPGLWLEEVPILKSVATMCPFAF
jgi:hypothetical protein